MSANLDLVRSIYADALGLYHLPRHGWRGSRGGEHRSRGAGP